MTEIRFRSKDHPEANGRLPKAGESAYTLRFPLEDGRVLAIEIGQKGFDAHTNLMMDMLTNAPSHDDGSTKGLSP